MNEKERKVLKLIEEFSKRLPKFSDGRINYTDSDAAPVVDVFVKYQEKILLLKRSDKVSTYQGKWNCVSGYLDEIKPLKEKALQELKEELAIKEANILSTKIGKTYSFTDDKTRKTYIVHPILVELESKPDIKLDFEHTECRWIKPAELKNFNIVPELNKGLEAISHLI